MRRRRPFRYLQMSTQDESPLEFVVKESLKTAKNKVSEIQSRRKQQTTQAERIGMFVTALRTELMQRRYTLPQGLLDQFEATKTELCDVLKWQDVCVRGDAKFRFERDGLRRTKRVRIWETDMTKPRIDHICEAKDDPAFDFNASFAIMRNAILDANIINRQAEAVNQKADQVIESLCKVAETLNPEFATQGV